LNTPAKIARKLRDIFVDDERFVADFSRLELNGASSKKISKYILCNIESQRLGRHIDWATDSGTIEHILPENPDQDWKKSYPSNLWGKDANRLGNLALLEDAINRRLGNATFQEKREGYLESSYVSTQDIAQLSTSEWTPDFLNDRQKRMADIAKKIWRTPYEDEFEQPKLI
jgi:hypothetical protein